MWNVFVIIMFVFNAFLLLDLSKSDKKCEDERTIILAKTNNIYSKNNQINLLVQTNIRVSIQIKQSKATDKSMQQDAK